MDASNPDTDVLVIGAGLTGAMIAAQLAVNNYRVAVIDAQAVADGATKRALGLVTPSLIKEHMPDTLRGLELLAKAAAERRVPPSSCQVLHLASKAADAAALKDLFESLDHNAPKMTWETAPVLPEGFDGGICVHDSVMVDLVTLTVKLLQHPNIQVRPHVEVHALEWSHDKMHVLAAGHTVRADAIVLATNSYAGLLSPYLADAARVVRGAAWQSQPLGTDLRTSVLRAIPMPLLIDDARLIAAQTPDGRLRISAWLWEVGAGDDDPSSHVHRFLKSRLPDLLNFTQQWQSTTTSVTRDGAPLVGELVGDGRVLYAIGAGRYGPAWAPVIAERIVQLMRQA